MRPYREDFTGFPFNFISNNRIGSTPDAETSFSIDPFPRPCKTIDYLIRRVRCRSIH